MMTTEVLMARHRVVVPASRREEYEGEMAEVIALETAEHGDTPEAARRISTIARSKAIDLMRSANTRKERAQVSLNKMRDKGWDASATQENPGEDYEIAEVVAKIDAELTPDELKLARLMRDGETTESAAKILGLPRETTRNHWRALQAKMRGLMNKYA